MHIFDTSLPFAPGPVLTHTDASVEDYRLLQSRLGLERNVIVQPSSYGRDHRVLLRSLRASKGLARGVAVIDPSATPEELEVLRAHGVVGVRFNLVQAGATDESMLEDVARLVEPLSWHIQLHLAPADLIRLANRLIALPVPIVLDHFARLNVDALLAGEVKTTVSRMLRSNRVWLKLSAPYIASPRSSAYEDLDGFVRRLAASHLDRLLWGSDWPHVTEADKPDDAVLMNLFLRWFSEDEIRQVLVRNPKVLYGFF
ncbi:putative TIM-barrel fold metal-dependent hydrolase [Variovorax boronicumulans]|uniref:TIM-barrel fold metal-dependent hydrolase n=1 Tax=Variovorax boronicumulans TaxID=436515 RepID=A0AAW8DUW0_9BURK|nr:amidohydrolase family protein [Variovorax boronicumulans]MDP9877969.1 putative TIM-barrel fold metal-dependent hydrolase [Variovorax boronicumulans]MDP9923253.1 putative TIM-barrel fold metal-dependent hydrolase [Variovorax boronicumulans]